MGQFALLGLAIAGTATTVYANRQSAGAQEVENELAQRAESQAAREREVSRRRRINAIMGAQSAEAAAAGIAMSGSVANISLTDAKRAGEDSLTDDANTRARIDALKRNRKTISKLSNIRSATTILGAGERFAGRGRQPSSEAA